MNFEVYSKVFLFVFSISHSLVFLPGISSEVMFILSHFFSKLIHHPVYFNVSIIPV